MGSTETRDYAFVDLGPDALAQVIVGSEFPAFEIPGVLAFCEAIGVEARQIRWEIFRPWNVALTPLGDTEHLREDLDRYRRAVAKGEEPIPPFRSLARRPDR